MSRIGTDRQILAPVAGRVAVKAEPANGAKAEVPSSREGRDRALAARIPRDPEKVANVIEALRKQGKIPADQVINEDSKFDPKNYDSTKLNLYLGTNFEYFTAFDGSETTVGDLVDHCSLDRFD